MAPRGDAASIFCRCLPRDGQVEVETGGGVAGLISGRPSRTGWGGGVGAGAGRSTGSGIRRRFRRRLRGGFGDRVGQGFERQIVGQEIEIRVGQAEILIKIVLVNARGAAAAGTLGLLLLGAAEAAAALLGGGGLDVLVGHVAHLVVFQLHAAVAEFLAQEHDALAGAQAAVGAAGLLGSEAVEGGVVGDHHHVASEVFRGLHGQGLAGGR